MAKIIKKLSKQHIDIKDYMERNGSITKTEAMLNIGVGNLGGRINEMRDFGIPIETVMEKVTKKDGTKAVIGRYRIVKEDK